jgi:tetratricopeptide (TPR) repeat protein
MMRNLTLLFLLAGLLGGCDSSTAPSQKDIALQNWASARAGVLLNLARDQYTNGDFDKAAQTIDQATQMDPSNPNLHIMAAKIAIEQSQLELADQELNAARALNPKLAETDYLSGVIYQRWQQPAKALIFYQRACKEAPSELAYLTAQTETLVNLNRQPEALAMLQSKVDFFEHSPVIHDEMGMILLQQHEVAQAIETFRWANILAPDDLTVREHLSLALFENKNYAEAATNLKRLVKEDSLSKRADLHLTLAECQFGLGRVADARISAQTACDLDPTSPTAWLTLAKISMQLGDQHRAEIGLNKALALDSSSAPGYLLLGYLRLRQNDLHAALVSFKQAVSLDSSDTTSLCMTGYVLEKLSRHAEAAGYYQQALKLDPHDSMANQFMTGVGGD